MCPFAGKRRGKKPRRRSKPSTGLSAKSGMWPLPTIDNVDVGPAERRLLSCLAICSSTREELGDRLTRLGVGEFRDRGHRLSKPAKNP